MFNTKEHKVESLQPCVQLKLFKLDSKEKIKKFCHTYILEKEFLNLNKYLVLTKYLDVNQEDRQKKTQNFCKAPAEKLFDEVFGQLLPRKITPRLSLGLA